VKGRFKRHRGVRVLIADDDPLARAAIKAAIEEGGDFTVCGEAATGFEAITMAGETGPEVIVMDVVMPELDGVAATRRIVRDAPETKIIMLATLEDEELALLALRSGATGYLPKRMNLQTLPRVLGCVLAGEAAISRALTARLVERFRLLPESSEGVRPVRSDLTSREWEVLDLLCAGQSTERIAGDLGMSIETVRSHVKRILRKLGVHSRAEAVEMAEAIRHRALQGGQAHSESSDRVLTPGA
jgi:two-component system, NarL family, response regulator LiaR